MNLSGSLTRQKEEELAVGDVASHVANMGRMVEEMESRMRDTPVSPSLPISPHLSPGDGEPDARHAAVHLLWLAAPPPAAAALETTTSRGGVRSRLGKTKSVVNGLYQSGGAEANKKKDMLAQALGPAPFPVLDGPPRSPTPRPRRTAPAGAHGGDGQAECGLKRPPRAAYLRHVRRGARWCEVVRGPQAESARSGQCVGRWDGAGWRR